MVRPDQATPVALIVSELVTNALKYAHPAGVAGRILVSCRLTGAGLVVEVTDDGVGLSEDFDPHSDGGLGFRVVRGLARQLGADLVYESSDIGLIVRLVLGADEDEHQVIPLWPGRD
jgi:two-component sensor histidine kinase